MIEKFWNFYSARLFQAYYIIFIKKNSAQIFGNSKIADALKRMGESFPGCLRNI
jgi:hypothetical protein